MHEYYFPELRIGGRRFLLGKALVVRSAHHGVLLEPGNAIADAMREEWGIKLYHPTMPRIAVVEKRIPVSPHLEQPLCCNRLEGMPLHPVQCTAPQAHCLAVPYTEGIMDYRKGLIHAALLCAISPYCGYQLMLPTGRAAALHDAIHETWTLMMECYAHEQASNTANLA